MSRNKRRNGADVYYDAHLNGGRVNTNQNPNITQQVLMERMYIRILSELSVNRFKWDGLPDEINARFLEMQLLYRALAVFYYEEQYGKFLVLRGSGNGVLNMMDDPTHFQVTGNTFISKTLKAKDCVPIWANFMRMSEMDVIAVYAHKLAYADRTVEINFKNARRTKIITTSENGRLTAANINQQIDEGAAAITVAQSYDLDAGIQALDLGVEPRTIGELHIVRTRLWNECMGLLGINNANQDKKERLVSSEVDANNDQVSTSREGALSARQFAADAINKKYGLTVSVAYNGDLDTSLPTLVGSASDVTMGD